MRIVSNTISPAQKRLAAAKFTRANLKDGPGFRNKKDSNMNKTMMIQNDEADTGLLKEAIAKNMRSKK